MLDWNLRFHICIFDFHHHCQSFDKSHFGHILSLFSLLLVIRWVLLGIGGFEIQVMIGPFFTHGGFEPKCISFVSELYLCFDNFVQFHSKKLYIFVVVIVIIGNVVLCNPSNDCSLYSQMILPKRPILDHSY